MRVVGDSGIEFDLDDTVATSMVNSGHVREAGKKAARKPAATPPDGVQDGEVAAGEPETGPATDEAQDILHDTKPEPKRTRARKPATDES
ncbi:hypothetical protein [Curtobacterium sp. BRD11]|uniref:hypothetical protein n=1 Tax=Curtobacterium sp. BRD11 TaxID=2962581 RepID=UPI002881BDC1|nr:hypothetical protein [Curtobacterium sp. BRD11]MDT0211237.1 hypothetical protein [Curtobacterium sp. BRD11]